LLLFFKKEGLSLTFSYFPKSASGGVEEVPPPQRNESRPEDTQSPVSKVVCKSLFHCTIAYRSRQAGNRQKLCPGFWRLPIDDS
jgi:hypothetical protein